MLVCLSSTRGFMPRPWLEAADRYVFSGNGRYMSMLPCIWFAGKNQWWFVDSCIYQLHASSTSYALQWVIVIITIFYFQNLSSISWTAGSSYIFIAISRYFKSLHGSSWYSLALWILMLGASHQIGLLQAAMELRVESAEGFDLPKNCHSAWQWRLQ